MSQETPNHRIALYAIAAVVAVLVSLFVAFTILQTPSFLQKSGALGNTQARILPLSADEIEGLSLPLNSVLQKADAALASGELSEAVRLYEQALEHGVDDLSVMRRLFDTAVLLGDRKKAESVLGLLSFRSVPEVTLDALRAFLDLREGKVDIAHQSFSKNAQRAEHLYGLMITQILRGEHEEAQESVAQLQKSTDPLLNHAAQSVRGAYDEFALFQDGKPSHLHTLLARALTQIGQCPSALLLLDQVLREEGDYRDAWIVQGYCRLMLQDYQNALTSFEHAYSLDPEKAETQYFLGLTHEKLGNVDRAQTFLSYALQNGFSPQHAVREKLSKLALDSGNPHIAIEHYIAMIESNVGASDAVYQSLVSLLIGNNEIDDARQVALDARDANGDTAIILDLVGWTAMLTEDYDEAATFLNTAVQQDPSLASAWYHKGLLEEKTGSYQESLKSLRTAYDLALGIDSDIARKAAEKHNEMVEGL